MAYHSTPPPEDGQLLEKRLEYLYLRRSVLDKLIESLELYQELQGRAKPPVLETHALAKTWARRLAS
jgi:hypothetical protein